MHVLVIDEHLGRRLRRRRRLLGMTQADVGEASGTTFQQIQKYEAGQAAMSAHRLWRIANALDVSITYFFDGLHEPDAQVDAEIRPQPGETAAVLRAFGNMRENQRRQFLDLAVALAGASDHLAARALDASARRLHASG